MKRILWVVGVVPNKVGGFERTCIEFARQSVGRKMRAHFVFEARPCPQLAAALASHAADWTCIPDVGALSWKQTWPLLRQIMRIRPDFVHLHFCEFYKPFFLVAAIFNVPLVATYHYSGRTVTVSVLRRLLKRCRRRFLRGSLKTITAPSAHARRTFINNYLECPQKVIVVHNGTDVAPPVGSSPAERPQAEMAGDGVPRIVFVGSLALEKGPQVAIRAMALLVREIPEIELDIVGEGPEESRLRELATNMGVGSHVRFLGRRDDVPSLLMSRMIMVTPSIWPEAFGFVLIEAMALGCPTIAAEVGGIPEVIRNGFDGVLVPPGNVEELAKAIAALCKDRPLRRRLQANARVTVAERFRLDFTIARYLSLYG
jgi:glycosyltransferase involved in cell wall biosynthesis